MDYSAVSTDTETLHGASPWGSSSPRAERTDFAAPDSPTSPIAASRAQHAHNQSQDSITSNPFANESGSAAAGLESVDPPAADSSQAAQARPAAQPQEPVPDAGSEEQLHSHQQRQQSAKPGAVRYQNSRQHRLVPAYKLQAKVTVLERTGRKDPVIRFDVYVRSSFPACDTLADFYRPIYPSFERLNFAMYAERTPSSSSCLSTSFHRTLKP